MGCRGACLVAGALTTAVLASCIGLFTEPSAAPVPIPTQRLAVTVEWTCLLEADGEIGCVGSFVPPRLTPGDGSLRFVMIDGGTVHACGLTADSSAFCWGGNSYGQLGDGTTMNRDRPSKVDSPVKFVSLAVGAAATCGLDPAGRAYCWGRRERGQVGDGLARENTIATRPAAVSGSQRFVAVDGASVSCGLTKEGRTYCWGYVADGFELHGQPGDCGSSYYYLYHGKQCLTPTPLVTSLRFTRITASGCGATRSGAAYCWGEGDAGQLGDGRFGVSSMAPVAVQGGHSFRQLTEGWYHRCGLDIMGEAYCWGNNFSGQLGIGTEGVEDGGLSARNVPTAVLTEQRFVELEAGSYRTCGLTAADELWCWGYNRAASFGPGATEAFYPVPVRVEMPPG